MAIGSVFENDDLGQEIVGRKGGIGQRIPRLDRLQALSAIAHQILQIAEPFGLKTDPTRFQGQFRAKTEARQFIDSQGRRQLRCCQDFQAVGLDVLDRGALGRESP